MRRGHNFLSLLLVASFTTSTVFGHQSPGSLGRVKRHATFGRPGLQQERQGSWKRQEGTTSSDDDGLLLYDARTSDNGGDCSACEKECAAFDDLLARCTAGEMEQHQCECNEEMFGQFITCAMCEPEHWQFHPRGLKGFVEDAVAECRADGYSDLAVKTDGLPATFNATAAASVAAALAVTPSDTLSSAAAAADIDSAGDDRSIVTTPSSQESATLSTRTTSTRASPTFGESGQLTGTGSGDHTAAPAFSGLILVTVAALTALLSSTVPTLLA